MLFILVFVVIQGTNAHVVLGSFHMLCGGHDPIKKLLWEGICFQAIPNISSILHFTAIEDYVAFFEFQNHWTSSLNSTNREDIQALVLVRLSAECFFTNGDEKIVYLHKSTKIDPTIEKESFQRVSVKFYLNEGSVHTTNAKTESSFQFCTIAEPRHGPIEKTMPSNEIFSKKQEITVLVFGKVETKGSRDFRKLYWPEAISCLAVLDSECSFMQFSPSLVSAIFLHSDKECPFISSVKQSKFTGMTQSGILQLAYQLRERAFTKFKPVERLVLRHIRTPIEEGSNNRNLLFIQEEDAIELKRLFLPEHIGHNSVHIIGASFLSECVHDSVSDLNVSSVEHLAILLDFHESAKVIAFAARERNPRLTSTYLSSSIWLFQSLYLSNQKLHVGMISISSSKPNNNDAIPLGFYNTFRAERVTKEKTLGPFMYLTQVPLRVTIVDSAANFVHEPSILIYNGFFVVKRLTRIDHVPRPRLKPRCSDRCSIVTGGNRGLGFEMVKYLAKEKFNSLIVVTCRSGKIEAEKQRSIEALNCRLIIRQCDWSDRAAVTRFSEWVIEYLPEISYFIHCAGSISFKLTHEISETVFNSVAATKVNCLGSLSDLRIPVHMEYIVSSTSGLWPQVGASHYNAASCHQLQYAGRQQCMGLSSIATAFGPFKSVGMAALFE